MDWVRGTAGSGAGASSVTDSDRAVRGASLIGGAGGGECRATEMAPARTVISCLGGADIHLRVEAGKEGKRDRGKHTPMCDSV